MHSWLNYCQVLSPNVTFFCSLPAHCSSVGSIKQSVPSKPGTNSDGSETGSTVNICFVDMYFCFLFVKYFEIDYNV